MNLHDQCSHAVIARKIKPAIKTTMNCLWRLLSHFSSKAAPKKGANPTKVLESLERWSAGATIIIFAAMVIEAWSAFHFQSPSETAFEVVTKVGADLAIGAALIIEAICIVRAIFVTRREKGESDEKVATAEARAAEANARAMEAEAEIERLLEHARRAAAPRRMDEEIFAEAIAQLPKGHAIILYDRHVPDAYFLAGSFAGAFQRAGWDTEAKMGESVKVVLAAPIIPWHSSPSTVPGQQPWGISLVSNRPGRADDKDAPLTVLTNAIFKSGAEISVNRGIDPELPDNTIRLIVCAKAPSWPGSRLATTSAEPSATAPAVSRQ